VAWAIAEFDGRRNICPLSWQMIVSKRPPMMAICLKPSRYSHNLIVNAGEFVLAWPGDNLADITLELGNSTGCDVDKFTANKLTTMEGEFVRTPLIRECIANLECSLVKQITTGDHTMFIAQVMAVWVNQNPQRPLCLVNDYAGYDQLGEKGGYRVGAVRKRLR
jgi:flavin reductase (DIM6/NTAB) family NADH-FMN oxidoreductase RutF